MRAFVQFNKHFLNTYPVTGKGIILSLCQRTSVTRSERSVLSCGITRGWEEGVNLQRITKASLEQLKQISIPVPLHHVPYFIPFTELASAFFLLSRQSPSTRRESPRVRALSPSLLDLQTCSFFLPFLCYPFFCSFCLFVFVTAMIGF